MHEKKKCVTGSRIGAICAAFVRLPFHAIEGALRDAQSPLAVEHPVSGAGRGGCGGNPRSPGRPVVKCGRLTGWRFVGRGQRPPRFCATRGPRRLARNASCAQQVEPNGPPLRVRVIERLAFQHAREELRAPTRALAYSARPHAEETPRPGPIASRAEVAKSQPSLPESPRDASTDVHRRPWRRCRPTPPAALVVSGGSI